MTTEKGIGWSSAAEGFSKVGRAPAALNFAADTGWDTDW